MKREHQITKIEKKTVAILPVDNISNLIILKDSRLAIATFDFILIFDTKTFHNDIVYKMSNINDDDDIIIDQLDNGHLIATQSKNICIFIIRENYLILIKTITNAHEELVNILSPITSNEFASCDNLDSVIKIWQYRDNVYSFSREINEGKIPSIILRIKNNKMLLYFESGNELSFWNTQTYQKETSIVFPITFSEFITIKELLNGNIAIASRFELTIMNSNTYHNINTYNIKNTIYCLIELQSNVLLCGCDEQTLCLLDLDNGHNRLYTYKTTYASYLVRVNENTFVSAESDKLIKWSY